MPTRQGSVFLFRLFGVNVYIHWSWLLVVWFVYDRMGARGHVSGMVLPVAYHVLSVLALFAIVLMHEFGHILACKSVGGKADTIVLWPLGGVAYVSPPQRPAAFLWSIVAGPLVNVVLLPVTLIPAFVMHLAPSYAADFIFEIALTNLVLLIFNLLPIYPLDGGKILWSLLWFVAGRGLSLVIAASVGVAGTLGLVALGAYLQDWWLVGMSAFLGMQSFGSIKLGMMQYRIERLPRRLECRCPNCQQHPPISDLWMCACGNKFDTFGSGARCPACARMADLTSCPFCYQASPMELWYPSGFPVMAAGGGSGFTAG